MILLPPRPTGTPQEGNSFTHAYFKTLGYNDFIATPPAGTPQEGNSFTHAHLTTLGFKTFDFMTFDFMTFDFMTFDFMTFDFRNFMTLETLRLLQAKHIFKQGRLAARYFNLAAV